jgi:preprotein translocase subunit YajC
VIHPSFLAFLAPSGSGQGSGALMVVFLQIGALIAIFWFLLIRPQRQQQAKHQDMLKGLKRGDEVVTGGGIIGRVIHIKDDRVTIESGESRLVVERERITKVMSPEAAAEPAAK